MKVIFENNSTLGAGYGIFKITKRTQSLSSPYSFMLKCSSNSKSLVSQSGWQDASKENKVDNFTEDAATVTIFVGPEIVDHLDAMELYRFSLISHNAADKVNMEESATLELDSINYSPLYGTGVVAKDTIKTIVPEAKPENPPIVDETPLTNTPNNAVDNNQNNSDIHSNKSLIIKIIMAILLLGVIIFSLLFFGKDYIKNLPFIPASIKEMLNDTTKTPDLSDENKEKAEQDKLEKDKAEQDKLAQDKLEKNKAEQDKLAKDSASNQKVDVQQLSPRQQVQNFLKTDNSTKDTIALAQKLEKEEDGLDYSFIMWEVAAEKGDTQGMMMVAKFYNPADATPHGSIIKDPNMALSWYKKAEQVGMKEATAKIEELKKWAENESAKGSSQATEFLRNLQ